MERVSHKDLEALLTYLREIYSRLDLEGYVAHIVTKLPEMVPSELTAYHVFNPQNQTLAALTEPEISDLAKIQESFHQHVHEHPILNHCQRTHDAQALKISDFLSQRQYRKLGLYNECYRELETEYQMGITWPGSPSQLSAIALNRSSKDFSERDRLLVNLLRPHLVQAYRNVEAVTQLQQVAAHVNQALEESNRGVIVLGENDEIHFCTEHTWQWVSEYFEPSSQTNRLPETLLRWVEHQRSLLSEDDNVPPPCTPLVLKRVGTRFVVRLIANHQTGEAQRLLILEEQQTMPFSSELVQPLGLTAREKEILSSIARGKSSRQIAKDLYISPYTVNKHLEHIYRKLGVGSRTEAVAVALEWKHKESVSAVR